MIAILQTLVVHDVHHDGDPEAAEARELGFDVVGLEREIGAGSLGREAGLVGLACGRPEGGFARLRCDSCGEEHILAFSCQTRNFCGSCQAKRAALFGEKLTTKILPDVPVRHFIFTIPKALRGLFRRERKLLGLLSASRCILPLVAPSAGPGQPASATFHIERLTSSTKRLGYPHAGRSRHPRSWPAGGDGPSHPLHPERGSHGRKIDQDHWREAALAVLGRLFRGATAFPSGRGVWRDDARGGALVFDDTVLVTSYVSQQDFAEDSLRDLRSFLHRLGRETNQGEVGVVIAGSYYGITDFDESSQKDLGGHP